MFRVKTAHLLPTKPDTTWLCIDKTLAGDEDILVQNLARVGCRSNFMTCSLSLIQLTYGILKIGACIIVVRRQGTPSCSESHFAPGFEKLNSCHTDHWNL